MTEVEVKVPERWVSEVPANRVLVHVADSEKAIKESRSILDVAYGFALPYWRVDPATDKPVEQVGLLVLLDGYQNPVFLKWPASDGAGDAL